MRKTLTADKVKKLPIGTDVYWVQDATGKSASLWIVKSGRKKLLKGIYTEHEIRERPGWHYEVEIEG